MTKSLEFWLILTACSLSLGVLGLTLFPPSPVCLCVFKQSQYVALADPESLRRPVQHMVCIMSGPCHCSLVETDNKMHIFYRRLLMQGLLTTLGSTVRPAKFTVNRISAKRHQRGGRKQSITKISPRNVKGCHKGVHWVRGSEQLPFLKCFTGSDSRSKKNWISSGWVPARKRRTMAMRVPEADFPWVLLPVLFFIRPYKILKSQNSVIYMQVLVLLQALESYSKDFKEYTIKLEKKKTGTMRKDKQGQQEAGNRK